MELTNQERERFAAWLRDEMREGNLTALYYAAYWTVLVDLTGGQCNDMAKGLLQPTESEASDAD